MKVFPFKIGSDPEFVVVSNGMKLSTPEIYSRLGGNTQRTNEHGQLGQDHNDIAELRPTAEYAPEAHVAHIGALLKMMHEIIPIAELKTTSLWAPIGGHVHLEIDDAYSALSDQKRKGIWRCMMSFAIPLVMGENPINSKMRQSGGYGKLNDFRSDHDNTWEFRPLTAEWLTTPETAMATLSYLGVLWNEFTNHPDKLARYKEVSLKTDSQTLAIQDLAIDEFNTILDGYSKNLKKFVREMELYPLFKEECELAMDWREMRKIKERVDWDMVKGWKMRETGITRIPSKRNLLSEKITKRRIEGMNLDQLKEYQNIAWTGDRGVETFARKIGDRMLAWKWSPNFRLFFYALPKGVPEPLIADGNLNIYHGAMMAKTQGDAIKIDEILKNATRGFSGNRRFSMNIVDLKKGKQQPDLEHSLMVGVPYEMRTEGEIKNVLELIHDIDTAKKEVHTENIMDIQLPEVDVVFKRGSLVEAIEQAAREAVAAPAPVSPDEFRATSLNITRMNDVTAQIEGDISDTPDHVESARGEAAALEGEDEILTPAPVPVEEEPFPVSRIEAEHRTEADAIIAGMAEMPEEELERTIEAIIRS